VNREPEPHKRHALKIIDALLAVALSDAEKSAAITQNDLNNLRRLFDRIAKELERERKWGHDQFLFKMDQERKLVLCGIQRDEARRMYCISMRSTVENERQIAKRMGWDCFGEGGAA
jgi:hypothetical protein